MTHKITRAVARIKAGLEEKIYLGNLEARRDWGYAPEYVGVAAWMMLQQDEPDDYVVGTGQSHSVRDFLDAAFAYVGIKDWSHLVGIDPRYYRPAEVEDLIADASKAKKKLGWEPQVKFEQLVGIMMDADLKAAGIDREGVTALGLITRCFDMDLKDKKIVITGGSGFLGGYVVKELQSRGVPAANIRALSSKDFDLRTMPECEKAVVGQDVVIHLAGVVGGIGFNRERPGELFYDNLMMGVQMMEAARRRQGAKNSWALPPDFVAVS